MIVRRATEADLPALCELMQHVQDPHAKAHPEIFEETLAPDAAADFFVGLLPHERHVLLVAERETRVVGYVWCEERQAAGNFYRKASHSGYVHHISVAPEARRQGAGKTLIEEALTVLRQRGATSVAVDFWTFNARAAAFFAGLGFAVQREIAARPLA